MAMTPLDGPALAGMLAGLGLAAAHLVWLVPRLSPRAAWAITGSLVAASAALMLLIGNPVAMAVPIAAVLFGHAAHARAARAAGPRVAAEPVPPPPRDSAPVTAPPATSASIAAAAARPIPATLGRYRIDSQIGRGSMGAVYLGHDPTIGRQVAIKTMALTQEFEGEALTEARERFFREAETAGRLQHPGIVTIFDAGEDQGLAWIAMEYLRGHDLQRYTQPGRLLPVHEALSVVARVADALGYAHSQGVVHRDIKPANVMVDPAGDSVKVTDFGIARIADNSRTRTGLVLGTPSFMSPEQMAGRRVDGRSDLYSLGVMLFQLLTGVLPFRAESMAKLMFQIANEPAPDVRGLRAELPEAVANVVALALEKRPEVRYSEGQQFAADLRMLIAAINTEPAPEAAPAAPAEAAAPPPQADPFAATVKFSRPDPMHNSQP